MKWLELQEPCYIIEDESQCKDNEGKDERTLNPRYLWSHRSSPGFYYFNVQKKELLTCLTGAILDSLVQVIKRDPAS